MKQFKLFFKRFKFPKRDWYPVWSTTDESMYQNPYNSYTILFSPSRNDYKLKMVSKYSHMKPQLTSAYQIAINKLNEFKSIGHLALFNTTQNKVRH